VFVDEVFLFLALGGCFVEDSLGAGEGVLGLLQPFPRWFPEKRK
jgi:hypothetical protein